MHIGRSQSAEPGRRRRSPKMFPGSCMLTCEKSNANIGLKHTGSRGEGLSEEMVEVPEQPRRRPSKPLPDICSCIGYIAAPTKTTMSS